MINPSGSESLGNYEMSPLPNVPTQTPVDNLILDEKLVASLNLLFKMQDLLSLPYSKWDENKKTFNSLLAQLPQEMQEQISKYGLTLASSQSDWKKLVVALLGFEKSVDLGGHGGNICIKMKMDNQNHYLFLKKFDETEARNYQVIKALSPKLLDYMPKVYGEATLGTQKFLIMENTRVDDHGNSLKQLLDIKLAGKVEGLENPIANQEEMVATRGTEKNILDYEQMKIGAEFSPDYMIASKGLRAFRVFNYSKSKEALIHALQNEPLEKKELLLNELKKLKRALEDSPVAFIGASIILIKQSDGSIKPLLIDPAHMQVDPKERDSYFYVLRGVKNIYYGTDKKYNLQRISNFRALNSFITHITTGKTELIQKMLLPSAPKPIQKPIKQEGLRVI